MDEVSKEFKKLFEDNLYMRIPKELIDKVDWLDDKRIEVTMSNWIMNHQYRRFTKQTVRVITQVSEGVDTHGVNIEIDCVLRALLDFYEKLVDQETGKHMLWEQFKRRLRVE